MLDCSHLNALLKWIVNLGFGVLRLVLCLFVLLAKIINCLVNGSVSGPVLVLKTTTNSNVEMAALFASTSEFCSLS